MMRVLIFFLVWSSAAAEEPAQPARSALAGALQEIVTVESPLSCQVAALPGRVVVFQLTNETDEPVSFLPWWTPFTGLIPGRPPFDGRYLRVVSAGSLEEPLYYGPAVSRHLRPGGGLQTYLTVSPHQAIVSKLDLRYPQPKNGGRPTYEVTPGVAYSVSWAGRIVDVLRRGETPDASRLHQTVVECPAVVVR